MSMKDYPAFPVEIEVAEGVEGFGGEMYEGDGTAVYKGLSKREYIAIESFKALIHVAEEWKARGDSFEPQSWAADTAVGYADALIARLEKDD